ncbi:transcription initiation factor TFIID subunit 5 [Nematocida minor]|uniref:transcription initiation factor TFIID subunit 5 n=1 Tax=Nematocida minor TaxID=1912983 RepID=UPI00222062CB|nr:transcription initiation factor TFIID subunit 5 [Nematocida minor]XP_051332121.1 transcription initiation factor TFIID subunit 5 [Nematocida minor]KAI5188851.1 transcription initiation factor TFIID subunit 5 [Nematocida minor]KAI5188955.1 transcription initiation factor TFIID subunit 5 [Nematocida minor]
MDRDNRNEKSMFDKRGYRRHQEMDSARTVLPLNEYVGDRELHSRLSVRNSTLIDPAGPVDSGYAKLRQWVDDSLDSFKNDLSNLLFPVFIHLYLDMISMRRENEALALMNEFKEDFIEVHANEIRQIEMVRDMSNLKENMLAMAFISNKYHLTMGKYAFDLLIDFLELNGLLKIGKIVNQYLNIKVFTGKIGEDVVDIGLVGVADFDFNKKAISSGVHYISPKVEELVLTEEQYKYEYLDQFLSILKKKKSENVPPSFERIPSPNPSASHIASEIDKLRDLAKRMNVSKHQMPSICCYTVHNTFDALCCADYSPDLKMAALGYTDSYIEIHSLTDESLLKLKQSIYLKAPEMRTGKADDARDDIGKVVRLVGHSGPVYAVKFFASKRFLLSASQDSTIRLWSLDTYSEVAVYQGHFFPVWSVDIASNDYYFASGSSDRTACVWSVESAKPVRLFASSLSDIMSVKFHPNSNYLFTGSCDFKIRMHDLQDGDLVRLFVGHKDAVTCLDVSACGKYLVSGGKDKTVILWDIATGKKVFKYIGHDGFIFSVSFSYFSSLIVSSSSDNTVRLWDKNKGDLVSTYYTKSTPIIKAVFGYRNIISCLGAYTPKK